MFTIIELFYEAEEINHHGFNRFVGNQQKVQKKQVGIILKLIYSEIFFQNQKEVFGKLILKIAKQLGTINLQNGLTPDKS